MREQLREKIAGDITLSSDPGRTIRKWREEFGISQQDLCPQACRVTVGHQRLRVWTEKITWDRHRPKDRGWSMGIDETRGGRRSRSTTWERRAIASSACGSLAAHASVRLHRGDRRREPDPNPWPWTWTFTATPSSTPSKRSLL